MRWLLRSGRGDHDGSISNLEFKPISWDELDDPDLRPNRWTIRNVVARVAEVGDLFAKAQTDHQELPRLG